MQLPSISDTEGSHGFRRIHQILSMFWTENSFLRWNYLPHKLSDSNEKN